MSPSLGRVLVVASLLTTSAGANASVESMGVADRLRLAPVSTASFLTPHSPRLVLTIGAPKAAPARLGQGSMLRLMIDPHSYRWEIDALGGAWLSPVMANGTLVGRLQFRF
jgi:hypothetical protein